MFRKEAVGFDVESCLILNHSGVSVGKPGYPTKRMYIERSARV